MKTEFTTQNPHQKAKHVSHMLAIPTRGGRTGQIPGADWPAGVPGSVRDCASESKVGVSREMTPEADFQVTYTVCFQGSFYGHYLLGLPAHTIVDYEA